MPVTTATTTKQTIFQGLCDEYRIAHPWAASDDLKVFVNGETTESITLCAGSNAVAEIRRTGIERIFKIEVQTSAAAVNVQNNIYHGVLTTN